MNDKSKTDGMRRLGKSNLSSSNVGVVKCEDDHVNDDFIKIII